MKTPYTHLDAVEGLENCDVGLLHAAGIDTLHDLAESDPAELTRLVNHLQCTHAGEESELSQGEVERWIDSARARDPISVAHTELEGRLNEVGRLMTLDQWRDFVLSFDPLSTEQMEFIVDQTRLVIEQMYVHLSLKRIRRAVDPVQALSLLRQRIEDDLDHWQFHNEMLKILKSLGDIHTAYRLPPPYRHAVAFLPFLLQKSYTREAEGDQWQSRYLVTHTLWQGPQLDIPLQAGDEIISWNGVPMAEAVAFHAEEVEGSNPAAAHAFGLQFMTLRWLGAAFQPTSPWVIIEYRNREGVTKELRLSWRIIYLNPDIDGDYMTRAQYLWFMFNPNNEPADEPEGFNPALQIANATAMKLFAGHKDGDAREQQEDARNRDQTRRTARKGGRRIELKRQRAKSPAAPAADEHNPLQVESFLKGILEPEILEVDGQRLGYIGIRAFPFRNKTVDAGRRDWETEFVLEFRRLLAHMPSDGLIIDIRGNPGGSITNAEMLLQLLCPREIEPLPFQFLASPLTRQINRSNPWGSSISTALRTGGLFSRGLPLSQPGDLNHWGQEYFGPVALLTSALSYSAADHFAASFEDHKVGIVVGIDETTGGGGANVWFYGRHLLPKLPPEMQQAAREKWPADINLQFAARRVMRIRERAGEPIEEIGVRTRSRLQYRMTPDDLVNGERGLREFVAARLAPMDHYDLRVTPHKVEGAVRIEVIGQNMNWVELRSNGRGIGSQPLVNGADGWSKPVSFDLAQLNGDEDIIEIHGFVEHHRAGKLGSEQVARYKHRLSDSSH
ncbi:DUF4332 domain-containing protein [Seongchinamella unica]|uniref:DUF4332 domain-containing protein n=1 Tax=Seongchinamella unica TaxID=2547392 RepID=A0A4R5LX10_9GAMM|nr:DUF4332 domain-containing protein [Seongchinamella unica]TDG15967.1 DUF4332 domain-containing protein [Seongchinamella unica]